MDFEGVRWAPLRPEPPSEQAAVMWDVFFVVLTIVFFLASAAYVAGCQRLQ